ncbi:MAG: hypothetical protein JXB48_11050 [Candidatus Latescibacteria bacterium]|nr:hypothetical protein [Candidatus Latescibacterota bacterium]
MRIKVVIAIMALCLTVGATEIVKVTKIRGDYQLNFDDIYEIPIYPDIETMIVFPAGYTITLVMPGSPDFVSASVLQNTIYITRPVDHVVETNLAVHIVTPDGIEQKLMIRCVGPRRGIKVLAVNFTLPNTSEINRIVENMKARYTEQLSAELSHQEKELNKNIHLNTMTEARYLFIRSSRRRCSREYKGATVFLDGMINSRDNTYIYLVSSVKNGASDIFSLEKVICGSAKIDPELVSARQLSEHEYMYCFSIPQLQLPIKSKKVEFLIKIWSKIHTLSARIS